MRTLPLSTPSCLFALLLLGAACATAGASNIDPGSGDVGGAGGEGGSGGASEGAGGDSTGGTGGASGAAGTGGSGGLGGSGGSGSAGGDSSAGTSGASGAGGDSGGGAGGSGGASGSAGAGGAGGGGGSGGGAADCANVPIINEIAVYRASGGVNDQQWDYVELLNPAGQAGCAVSLVDYSLHVLDAAGASTSLWSGHASPTFKEGKYFLVGGVSYETDPTTNIPPDSAIANGSTMPIDGGCVQLMRKTTVVDVVCYGTASGMQGMAAPAPDAGMSISRIPDGKNTKDNSMDFKKSVPSPGATNHIN